MGNARYLSSDYEEYSTRTMLGTSTRAQIFKSSRMPQQFDPSKIVLRESCDSEQNPASTPIILALDVTGSMGMVAHNIAKDSLPSLMQGIYSTPSISDPHVMFMGVGDCGDSAPLQVSQFEAGAQVLVEGLTELWLEGRGGGNDYEAYDLPWYFAANKTAIDSFNKRQQKGFLFTFGDELPPQRALSLDDLRKVFGAAANNLPLYKSVQATYEAACKKYSVFHIVVEEGSYCRSNKTQVKREWKELMGSNALYMRSQADLPEIVIATMRIVNGEDQEQVIRESGKVAALNYAFSQE